MKKRILLLMISILFVCNVDAQTTLVKQSNITLSYTKSYYNTVEKYGCKFDQYKITGYVSNNSGKRIYWNWGSISYGGYNTLTCYNTLYAGGKVDVARGNTSGDFASFLYMDSGDEIKTSFYMLVYENDKPGDPGWNWSWEFR